jgi:hypothetical protein
MSKIQITGPSTGTGTLTITSTATNTDQTITFPNTTATVVAVDPGTASNVLTSNGSAWVSQAAAAGGGDYIMQVFTTPGTWTKAAGLKAIRVTVIGGGGATAAPSPGASNAGGTSSFGSPAFLSATGGTGSSLPSPNGAGGSGSGGQLNASGMRGFSSTQSFACVPFQGSIGGSSAFGFGQSNPSAGGGLVAGLAYGGGAAAAQIAAGGGGGAIEYIDAPALPGPQPYTVGAGGSAGPAPSAAGGTGVIIVEEFY